MTYKNIKWDKKYKDFFENGKFQYYARNEKFLEQIEKLLDYKKLGDN